MKLRIYWYLRRMLGYRRLTIRYARSGWITVDERDVVDGNVFSTGAYEPEVWEALSRWAERGEVLWDVGAHIGTFSIRALLDPRIQEIHAFEPNPEVAVVLEQHIRLNRAARGCTVHQIALDSVSGTRTLHLPPLANTGLASFARAYTSRTCRVECSTADHLVFEQGVPAPTLLKVDVEDWELAVLRGAQRLLVERPPRAIVFEAACDAVSWIAEHDLLRILEACGYEVAHIDRANSGVQERENFLAIHGAGRDTL